jgi:hypothetical protein
MPPIAVISWSALAVAASAGRKASIAISWSVMSTGVPKTVVVLRNESIPRSVSS